MLIITETNYFSNKLMPIKAGIIKNGISIDSYPGINIQNQFIPGFKS